MTGEALPDVVLYDGNLVPPEAALVSAFDRGLLYGESLFETLKVVEGAPCLWPAHLKRLAAGCVELGLPLDLLSLEAGVHALLEARPLAYGALRIQVTGGTQPGGGRGMTAPAEGRRPRVIATVTPLAAPAAAFYAAGVAVVTAGDLCRPLPWLKSGSYLASIAAKARAEQANAFECLLLGGHPPVVLEGSFSSVLAWDGHGLVVPPAAGRLSGVTLQTVVAEASAVGVVVNERPLPLETLARPRSSTAEEGGGADVVLLLAGSLLGVCECATLDGVTLPRDPEAVAWLREGLWRREWASRLKWLASAQAKE